MTEIEILQNILDVSRSTYTEVAWMASNIDILRGQIFNLFYSNAIVMGLLSVCTVYIVVGFIKRKRN